MFNRLSFRLLFANLGIVAILLLLLTLLLVRESARTSGAIRNFQTATELNAIARPVSNQINESWQQIADGGVPRFREQLDRIADNAGVRILWVQRANATVLFDSRDQWEGQSIVAEQRASSNPLLSNVGSYRAPNGTEWILYLPDDLNFQLRGNIATTLILAKQAPPPLQFFTSVFAQPLAQSALIATIVALVLAYVVSRSVARPLQKLATAAKGVAAGNYEQRLPLEGPEEVQSVADDFNQMAQQVKASQTAQRDFVANVSHDLKTPITSIQGWSQAMIDGTIDDGGMQQRAAEIINGEAERMSRMVRQLLDLARLESGDYRPKRTPLNLSLLLATVRDNLMPQSRTKNVDLRVEAGQLPEISADGDRLMQVFTNLVDNALAHTPAGGTITLRSWANNGHVWAAVEDTGRGIEAEEIGRIFERFYQVDKSRTRINGQKGTGLGLAIAKEIITAHGGTITATSQIGQGTTFTIRLPI